MSKPDLVFLTKENEEKVKPRIEETVKAEIEAGQMREEQRMAKLEEIKRKIIEARR